MQKPFPHLIVENMYNDEELKLIWEELEFLNKPNKFQNPENYGCAAEIVGDQKKYISNAKALNLDSVYSSRNFSNILTLNRKLFNYRYIYSNLDPNYVKFSCSNYDITKIRYYHNGEYYEPHKDIIYDTLACTYFHKYPQKFVGGELVFPQHNYQIECKNNLCVIFPAYFLHAVNLVSISNNDYYSGFGRYCMSQFTNAVHNPQCW